MRGRQSPCFRSIKLAPSVGADRVDDNLTGRWLYELNACRALLTVLRCVLIFGLLVRQFRLRPRKGSSRCEPAADNCRSSQQDRTAGCSFVRGSCFGHCITSWLERINKSVLQAPVPADAFPAAPPRQKTAIATLRFSPCRGRQTAASRPRRNVRDRSWARARAGSCAYEPCNLYRHTILIVSHLPSGTASITGRHAGLALSVSPCSC